VISKEINQNFDKSSIYIAEAIKYLGTYHIELKIHHDVSHTLELIIERVSG